MYETFSTKENVSVIIPAYNEGKTIGNIVKLALSHPLIGEVIVVDDGSKDDTVIASKEAGAKVIMHEKNKGKAAAMDTGVRQSVSSIIFFIDGDIVGFTHEMMDIAIRAVQSHMSDMHVVITDHGSFFSERLIKSLPLIAGIRVLRKSIWEAIPPRYLNRFEIEMALNFFANKQGARIESRVFKGLTQVVKERKRGLVWGFYQRIFMIRDLIFVFVRLYIFYNLRAVLRSVVVSEKVRD